MGLYKTQKFLHSKGNIQETEERADRKKMSASYLSDRGLTHRKYQEPIKLNKKNNNNKTTKTIKKWAKDVNRQPSKEKI